MDERVNAVKADPGAATAALQSFCDTWPREKTPFTFPELTTPAPAKTNGWRWINVWATWCKPCIEELPLLVEWKTSLAKDGAPFELVLLSLDTDDRSVEKFRGKHPGTPESLRVKDLDRVEEWLASMGLDGAATTIPVQIFVDPAGTVRCTRSGPVGRSDYATVKGLLSGS